MNTLDKEGEKVGLHINTQKTKIMVFGKEGIVPCLHISWHKLLISLIISSPPAFIYSVTNFSGPGLLLFCRCLIAAYTSSYNDDDDV